MAFATDAPVAAAAGEARPPLTPRRIRSRETGEVPFAQAVATVTTPVEGSTTDTVKGYSSLEAALVAAKSGDIVTLQQNINHAVTIMTAGITLEGNNKTISATGDAVTVASGRV